MELDGRQLAEAAARIMPPGLCHAAGDMHDHPDHAALVAIRRVCDETMLRKRSTQAWADALAEVARITHEALDR